MKYLEQTEMLNYNSNAIQALIKRKHWEDMNVKDRILHIYNYVRDEVAFGYNASDEIRASKVLKDGYGQCNTKGTLLMALLRAVGVPCRIHGFLIDKKMQEGAMNGLVFLISPKEITHSWVEIYYKDKWLNLEGFILDVTYLNKLQAKFSKSHGLFFGYGVATKDFRNPPIDWNENDTYIQKDGITKDLGTFDNPDTFFKKYPQKLNLIKKFFYQNIVRHLMNRNVNKIRKK